MVPTTSSIDWTITLATLQTVAGFGSILAAIGLVVWQAWDRSRAELRRKTAFLEAALELLDMAIASEKTWNDRREHGSPEDWTTEANTVAMSREVALARNEVMDVWRSVSSAVGSLRDRGPPDASVILVLTGCLQEMQVAEHIEEWRSPNRIGSAITIAVESARRRRLVIEETLEEFRRRKRLT